MLVVAARIGAEPIEAGTHPFVKLTIDECVAVPPAEVKKIVGVELGALLVDETRPIAGGVDPRDVTVVAVSCTGKTIALRVDDPITGKSLERSIDLTAEVPNARARLVALAIVELVSASWTELEANPAPKVPAVTATASPGAKDAAKGSVRTHLHASIAPSSSLRVLAIVGTHIFFPRSGPSTSLGLRLGGDRGWLGFLGWSADMQADHASVPVALGAVALDTVSASFALTAFERLGAITVRGGLGVRLGAARITGETSDSARIEGSSIAGFFAAPHAVASVSLSPWGPLVIEAAAEGGMVVAPVRGHIAGERDVGVAGGFFGATLGVGAAL
ncbi:MAG: hypothetical protein ABI175_05145 [Polyangiales bacterium]